MVDSGGADVLSAEALIDPAVAAALAICSFRSASPPDKPDPSLTAAVDLPPAWACHALRSERRIRDYTEIRLLSNSKDAATPKRRPSPVTPLEHRGDSGASESCSEEMLGKRFDIGGAPRGLAGPETKVSIRKWLRQSSNAEGWLPFVVVSGERELSDFRISGSKPIRRSPTKKKLMGLESRKRPNTAPMSEEVHEEVHPKQDRLPDLNIPLVRESDWQAHTAL